MPTTITGTDGVSQVQAGAVESGDLPAGSVIQVVQGNNPPDASTTSESFVDTGLSASITPTNVNNKILVIVNQMSSVFTGSSSDRFVNVGVYRDGTFLEENRIGLSDVGAVIGNNIINYVDTPSTTSSLTYSTKFHTSHSDSTAFVQYANYNSDITLMEIAG